MSKNKLLLFPCTIGGEINYSLPEEVKNKINETRYFIVENERSARRFLKRINKDFPIGECTFFLMDKHFNKKHIPSFFEPVKNGFDIGVLSEAGVPCVGDPGSVMVEYAHQKNIDVIPYTGPSSYLLALMASGLNGQKFAFQGYLPIKDDEKMKALKALEVESEKKSQTQIFMETPYRNNPFLALILKTLRPHTKLCIASALTTSEEYIKTKTIADWRKTSKPDIHKKPVVFLMYSGKK